MRLFRRLSLPKASLRVPYGAPLSLAATLCLLTLTSACLCQAEDSKPDDQGELGRVTAIAPTIWACPLEGWRLRQDDACDPIETGTVIKIYRRGVRPEYPHGPFALIEYARDGTTKIQYVIDDTVTPIDKDDPSIEELWERWLKQAGQAP